jgi:threonine/homoserine/homoserine lactone efflux protein
LSRFPFAAYKSLQLVRRCNVPEFIIAVLLLELTPGPNMAYLATLTLDKGRPAGLLAVVGVAAGLSVHAIVAALGLGALIANAPSVYEMLRWLGVAYILFLAWEGWQPGRANTSQPGAVPGPAGAVSGSLFWRGFFSNLFNPKSILFFVSVVPGFVRHESGDHSLPVQIALFGIVYVAIATIIHASIVVLASRLRPWLMTGSRQDTIRRILSLALLLVAAWLAWTTRRT